MIAHKVENIKDSEKLKAQEMSKLEVKSFKKRDIDVVIKKLEYENGLLKVIVEAKNNGNSIFVDNPIYFKNPPTMVPDGTKRTIKDKKGNDIEVKNLKEDKEEALKEIIVQVVEEQWRR